MLNSKIAHYSPKEPASIIIPVGLILPFSSSGAVPIGWAAWSLAANRNILGAGSTWAVGAVGGTTAITSYLLNSGGHQGSDFPGDNDANNDGGKFRNDSFAGNHQHSFATNYQPPAIRQPFIKAVTPGMGVIPPRVNAWSVDGLAKTGLSNNHATGELQHNGSYGSIGSATVTGVVSNSLGTHAHGIEDSGSGSGKDCGTNVGAHTHTQTLLYNMNLWRVRMAQWQHATSILPFYKWGPNPIGMWESLTPPAGWYLCDGTNGTPYLLDCFVQNSAYNDAQIGTVLGNGAITVTTAGTVAHGTHSHRGLNDCDDGSSWYYHLTGTAPAHAAMNHAQTWLPPYYALAFIMKG